MAIVCPGQGSQTPGFLAPWLEVPGLRDLLGALSEAASTDLITTATSDEDTIKDTAVARPLIGRRHRRTGPCSVRARAPAPQRVGRSPDTRSVRSPRTCPACSQPRTMTFVALRGAVWPKRARRHRPA